jgi:DNA-binding transcriptional LysR family regulator
VGFQERERRTSVTADGRVRITAAEGVREAVFAGLGLAVAPEWMFTPELKRGLVSPRRTVGLARFLRLIGLIRWARSSPAARSRADVVFTDRETSKQAVDWLDRGCEARPSAKPARR